MPLKAYAVAEGLALATTAGWKTAILADIPANVRPEFTTYGCNPKGTVNSDPAVRLRLIKCSSAGTGGNTLTVGKRSPGGSEVPQVTCKSGGGAIPFSVEPTTTGQPIDQKSTHPQQGFEEPEIVPESWEALGGEKVALQYHNESGGSGIVADFDLSWLE